MPPSGLSHLRVARPSRDLAAAERFWVAGLGLQVLLRVGPESGDDHPLLMVGWPGGTWHLELVGDPAGETPPAPTEEDLLVLYLEEPVDPGLVARLVGAGGTVVPARNAYWDTGGVTVADPDGYRLVLCSRSWPPEESA